MAVGCGINRSKGITTDDWLSAVNEAIRNNDDEGLTVEELQKIMKRGMCAVYRRLKLLHKQGKLKIGERTTTTLTGRRFQTPVYSIKR